MGTVRKRVNAVTEEAIAERRSEILRHAANVVVAAGVAGCTFAAVSEASGFSIGMIQHYFRTRDRLIEACIDHRLAQSEAESLATAASGETAFDRLRLLVDYNVVGEREFYNTWAFWIELFAAARLDEALSEKLNDRLVFWHGMFRRALEDAVASGAIAPTRPLDDLSHALVALLDGLALQAINRSYGMSVRQMHELLYGFAAAELDADFGEVATAPADYH